jgi:DNA polymerase-3 subunit delta'
VSWQRVRGHDHLIESFCLAFRRGRLAHAYLFAGPPGVGKRLFAHELAKALLCENKPSPDELTACDHCPACQQVEAGTHPDFFEVARPEESLELPIDVIRQLCQNLSLKPARGGRKVAILDDADDLNEESANSFLKTLEEPPPGSVLILIGRSADRQLPTIRSRCQLVQFAPLPSALVAELIQGEGDGDGLPPERLAALSEGSPGLARALSDPSLWSFRRQILDALSRPNPDAPALARAWQTVVEEAGKEAGVQRRRAALILRLVIDGLQQALRLTLGQIRAAALDRGEESVLRNLGQQLGPDGLLQRIERCLEADAQIDRRVQLVLVLEGLVDALA